MNQLIIKKIHSKKFHFILQVPLNKDYKLRILLAEEVQLKLAIQRFYTFGRP